MRFRPPGCSTSPFWARRIRGVFLAVPSRRFGTHAYHVCGIAALVVMFLFAGFADCPEMIYFFAAWFALIFVHRIEALARGWHRHSLYDGVPWVARLLRPANDEVAKGAFEPFILWLAGSLLCPLSAPLGTFVMCGGVPLFLNTVIGKAIVDVRDRRIRDKHHEMRAWMERNKNH